MADKVTQFVNAWESTVSVLVDDTTTTVNVADASLLTAPVYLVLDPNDDAKREFIEVTAISTNALTVTRYLDGSAATSGLTHEVSNVVLSVPTKQAFDDLHDRVDARTTATALVQTNLDTHIAGEHVQTLYVTATTTFVKADYPWCSAIKVTLVGSGGAGGGAPATSGEFAYGGGGGAGAWAESWILVSALATSETLTVPAGGTGVSGAAGNNGATCSFGSLVSAVGGAGATVSGLFVSGTPSTALIGGNGGLTYTGDVGGFGGHGLDISHTGAGSQGGSSDGGSSHFSAGGPFALSSNGVAGVSGSGGGGMRSGSTAAARTGGAGGAGLIICELYA